MVLKLLTLDGNNSKYKFSLSTIPEEKWEQFIKDVVCCLTVKENVTSIMASISIRDNAAKVKLAFDDGRYHEMRFVLDIHGINLNGYNDTISVIWQDILTEHFGEKYLVEANSIEC